MEERSQLFPITALKKLIVPLIIEQFLLMSVGFADSIMVARVGEDAISAVSLVDAISMLMIGVFSALGTGGAVVAAQFIGQRSMDKARGAAKQLVLVTAILSVVVLAVCLLFNESLLRLIFGNIQPEVMEKAVQYFLCSALSYPFIALYNGGAALFRAAGDSKTPMVFSVIMNLINIVFNAIFIFGCGWGVTGAGVATLMARAFACVAVMYLLTKRNRDLYIDNYLRIRWDWAYIRKIFAIGIPSGLDNGMAQLGRVMIQSLVSTFGTYAIAAHAVAGNINMFMIIPAQAITLAVITVVGQCIGAGEYGQAAMYTKKLLKWTYLSMVLLGILVVAVSPLLLKLYGLSGETTQLAMKCIAIHAGFGMLIWPLSFTLPNTLRAANDANFTMVVSILSMWIFRYLFSYLLGQYLGLELIGVWLAMGIDWLVRSVAFVLRYRSGRWKNRSLV